jgi:restriction system protein
VFLLVTPFAALRQYQRKRLLDAHADINSIRNLSWKDFEKLVAEAFHRQGYWVAEKGGANADGGIDIVLKRADERVLVQCKHWRTRMVGVAKVRELYGVMTAEHATRAVLVTSGSFSEDAIAFASGKPLELIDGPQLEDLVRTVRTSAPKTTAVQTASTALGCPECGGKMVRRTAKKGIMAGSSFWGCSRYPSCHGLRQIA